MPKGYNIEGSYLPGATANRGGDFVTHSITSMTSSDDLVRQMELTIDRKLKKGDIPVKKAMTDVMDYMKRRLIGIIKRRFPASDTFVRAPGVKYSGSGPSGGFGVGENLIGEVGLFASGLSDPNTGRPLASYMAAIQSPEQGQLRGRGSVVFTDRPNPPLVYTDDSGRFIPSRRVREHIEPWVKEVIGGSAKEIRRSALNIALTIDKKGAHREPIWTHIFKTPQNADGTLLGSVRPEVGRQIVKILERHGLTIGRNPFTSGGGRAFRGAAGTTGAFQRSKLYGR